MKSGASRRPPAMQPDQPQSLNHLNPPTHQTTKPTNAPPTPHHTKADFAFYADRLNRLVVEAGLGHLPFAEKTVVTPTGAGARRSRGDDRRRCSGAPVCAAVCVARSVGSWGRCTGCGRQPLPFHTPAVVNPHPPTPTPPFAPTTNAARPPLRRRRVLLRHMRRLRRAQRRVDGDGAARVLPGCVRGRGAGGIRREGRRRCVP